MLTVLCNLLAWWLQSFVRSVSASISEWRKQPEWPLLIVGACLFVGFVSHWLGYLLAKYELSGGVFGPAEWEGRTGWRKPLVFCISNTMIFGALRKLLKAQMLVPRSHFAHVAAWSTAVEVGIITLQAWRGVPSHFNTSTKVDAALYVVKLGGAALLSTCCVAATIGCAVRPSKNVSLNERVALLHGGSLVSVAIAFAVWQVVYGHSERQPLPLEDELCLRVTAGMHRSPCYEVRGGNILKLTHFLPLHATEPLLLLSWAVSEVRMVAGDRLIEKAAAAHWLLAVVGLAQSIRARSVFEPLPLIVMLIAMAVIAGCFVFVFLSPVALASGVRVVSIEPSGWSGFASIAQFFPRGCGSTRDAVTRKACQE